MPSVNSPPTDPGPFVFAGTGASRRNSFPGLVGKEVDRVLPGYPVSANLHVFAHSPAAGARNRHGWSDAAVYLAESGAGVLNLASMIWLQARADPARRSPPAALKVTQTSSGPPPLVPSENGSVCRP